LEIELLEVDDWTCCGASAAHVSTIFCLWSCRRKIYESEKIGLEVMAPCAACTTGMRQATHNSKKMGNCGKRSNQILQANFQGRESADISDVVL